MAKLSKEFVEGCLKLADDDRSKLTEMERTMPGGCSSKLRSFLNNVVSKENTKYLENIGWASYYKIITIYRYKTFLSRSIFMLQT